MMLAGDAARVWALKEGLEASQTAEDAKTMHLTTRARHQHTKYTNILLGKSTSESPGSSSNSQDGHKNNNKRQRTSKDVDCDLLNDTVGCCVVTARGQVASGVSSGGIAMKTSGRVGEAAVFGAGCWAEETENSTHGVAVSVTGVGERIMTHLVAKECAARVLLQSRGGGGGGRAKGKNSNSNDALSICTKYLKETIGSGPTPRDCGVLCAVSSTQEQPDHLHVALTAVFNESESMAVAWLSEDGNGKQRSEARVLRKNGGDGANSGLKTTTQSLVVGVHWPLES
jgi:taspase (threonine aspartase 1)